jgi:glutathione S-transferase
MRLYHFPSPNPQKVTFALKELGLDCEIVPVDLAKGEQNRDPRFSQSTQWAGCRFLSMAT